MRGQFAPLAPLTQEQQHFAAEHHDLICAFLGRGGLPVSEYYDVAALGFLHAVQRYLTQPWLRKYAFPTIAWQAMGREISKDYRVEARRRNAERLYLETRYARPPSVREEAEAKLILHDAFARSSPEQYQLAKLRAQGYTVREAALVQGIQPKRAYQLLGELRQICTQIYLT